MDTITAHHLRHHQIAGGDHHGSSEMPSRPKSLEDEQRHRAAQAAAALQFTVSKGQARRKKVVKAAAALAAAAASAHLASSPSGKRSSQNKSQSGDDRNDNSGTSSDDNSQNTDDESSSSSSEEEQLLPPVRPSNTKNINAQKDMHHHHQHHHHHHTTSMMEMDEDTNSDRSVSPGPSTPGRVIPQPKQRRVSIATYGTMGSSIPSPAALARESARDIPIDLILEEERRLCGQNQKPPPAVPRYTMDATGRKKRARHLTTPFQTRVLRRVLAFSCFPTTDQRTYLASELGMTPRGVQIWFQNQRQKAKARQIAQQKMIAAGQSHGVSVPITRSMQPMTTTSYVPIPVPLLAPAAAPAWASASHLSVSIHPRAMPTAAMKHEPITPVTPTTTTRSGTDIPSSPRAQGGMTGANPTTTTPEDSTPATPTSPHPSPMDTTTADDTTSSTTASSPKLTHPSDTSNNPTTTKKDNRTVSNTSIPKYTYVPPARPTTTASSSSSAETGGTAEDDQGTYTLRHAQHALSNVAMTMRGDEAMEGEGAAAWRPWR
ncbi:hypothetical protein HK104_004449 [Borealophlyctis nickersoniae]|nr:hypothetical protein HK104_004449 [Borealophlyctis nickersoniae]